MGLFDKFFKKNVPVKEKIFEDYFTEIQADMVSICLEYVENKADRIYLYASFESNVMTPNYFYDIGGTILNKHKLNDANNGFVYDVSSDRQKACLTILMEDIKKMVNLCKEHNRPMPTEIKMVYDVNTKEFHADYKYEVVYSNHKTKTAYDVVNEWMEQVKNQKNEKDTDFCERQKADDDMKIYEVILNGNQYAMLEKMLSVDRASQLAKDQPIDGKALFSDILRDIYAPVTDGWSSLDCVMQESTEKIDFLKCMTKQVFPEEEDYFLEQIGKELHCSKEFVIRIILQWR